MAWVAFAVSAALAQALTNLDNLAVLLAILLPVGAGRALSGYVAAQAVMLLAALGLAAGAAEVLAGWSGYLGLIPLSLGGMALWQRMRGLRRQDKTPKVPGDTPILAVTALFLGLSMDSLAVMAPLMADSTAEFRLAALIGAGSAVAGMTAAALALSRLAERAGGWVRRLERLGPYAMILAGLYVLSNSGTDLVSG